MQSATILGIKITTSREDEILEYITKSLEKNIKKYYIVTPNPEILVRAAHDPEFKKILNEATIALPDGIGIVVAAKLLGLPIYRRITGVDVMEKLCQRLSKRTENTGFLGGEVGIAQQTADCLRKKYPGLKVGSIGGEWSYKIGPENKDLKFKKNSLENKETINQKPLIKNNVDVLFVAYGAPKQEQWISENLDKLPVKVAMGVGGAFDYISGNIPRAPKFIQNLGLEWLFRLIIQPWRWKRQLALLEFGYLVIKEVFKTRFKASTVGV